MSGERRGASWALVGPVWAVPVGRRLGATALTLVLTGLCAYFSVANTPEQGAAFFGAGTAVLGVLAGVLVSGLPESVVTKDRSFAAARALANAAKGIDSTHLKLAVVDGFGSQRVREHLDGVKGDLEGLRRSLYDGVADWEAVDPELKKRLETHMNKGHAMLVALEKKLEASE